MRGISPTPTPLRAVKVGDAPHITGDCLRNDVTVIACTDA